jgi:hypothetical protein
MGRSLSCLLKKVDRAVVEGVKIGMTLPPGYPKMYSTPCRSQAWMMARAPVIFSCGMFASGTAVIAAGKLRIVLFKDKKSRRAHPAGLIP